MTVNLTFGGFLKLAHLSLEMTVKEVKHKLRELIKMPPPNQKLSTAKLGVLKDSCTLGSYCFVDGENVALGFKDRGGGR